MTDWASGPTPRSSTSLEQLIDDYLASPDTRKTGRHLSYDEADLRIIAQRLPGMDEGWADVATVQDLTASSLRAAFGKYLVDSTEQDIQRVARTWRGFVQYLSRRGFVNPTAMGGVPPPPAKRSRIRSVVVAPSKGLIITLIVPIMLVMAQEYIGSVQQQSANERTARNDRVRDSQVEAIAQTTTLFGDLSNISNKILRADLQSSDLPSAMKALQLELGSTINGIDTVAVNLPARFSDVDGPMVSEVSTLYNVYASAIHGVAEYIAAPGVDRARQEALLGALLVVDGVVRYLASDILVGVLNCFLDLDDRGAARACGLPRADAEEEVQFLVDLLSSEVEVFQLYEATNLPVLQQIATPQAQRFRELDRELSAWLAENPDGSFLDFPKYEELASAYYAIDRTQRLRATLVFYSEEFILDLAEFLDFKGRTEDRGPPPECDQRYPDLVPCTPQTEN